MPESALRQSKARETHERYLQGICVPKPDQRDLPTTGSARRRTLLKRGLLLQCPYCGQGGIIKYPFWIKDCCPKCGYRFAPESGYFVGGYALNLVGAEIIGAAILLPILFFPWSRTLWMALDLTIQGDSHLDKEKQPPTTGA